MERLVIFCIVVLLLAGLVLVVTAQEPIDEFEAGMWPDPFQILVNTDPEGLDCFNSQPTPADLEFEWVGEANILQISVLAVQDTNLSVLTPDGVCHNVDNFNGLLNPVLTIFRPDPGLYKIWIGGSVAEEVTLFITEFDRLR